VGDIQPVVVEYASDYPMIPIVLTGVAADPDMPVMVWVLGDARAIPRNYFHTKINDAEIDWLNAGQNYVEVITKAVDEADRHHSFVTEYAGASSILVDLIDYPGRFGDLDDLRAIADALLYVGYMNGNGFQSGLTPPFFTGSYTAQVLAILQKHLPVPARLLEELTASGAGPSGYYSQMDYWVEVDRVQRPEIYEDLDLEFDPVAMTDELEERVVKPTVAAGKLFRDNSYLTRLFTTLSPNEMTRDPVFSFNPELPEVSNLHEGRLIYHCGLIKEDTPTTTPAVVVTEDGWELVMPNGTQTNPWLAQPWPKSRFIQVVREEGEARSVVDNSDAIAAFIADRGLKLPDGDGDGDGGCAVGVGSGALGSLGLGALAALFLLRRRRR
jgi:MYXO-CTERM domain-containing protein